MKFCLGGTFDHSRWAIRAIGFLLIVSSMFACTSPNRVDRRDHAIDYYQPQPRATNLAKARAVEFWSRNEKRFPGTRYLAVDADTIFPSEVQDLWPKLIASQTTAEFFSHGLESGSYSDLSLYAVVIFDTQTQRLVNGPGYAVVELPAKESVARFGPYLARFIR